MERREKKVNTIIFVGAIGMGNRRTESEYGGLSCFKGRTKI